MVHFNPHFILFVENCTVPLSKKVFPSSPKELCDSINNKLWYW